MQALMSILHDMVLDLLPHALLQNLDPRPAPAPALPDNTHAFTALR